jgi:hypothetical protein
MAAAQVFFAMVSAFVTRWQRKSPRKNPGLYSFIECGGRLNQTRFDERVESTIFGDRFDGLAGEAQFHVVAEFRHPDALILKVGRNFAFHHLGDVTTDTAFFLGETGTMNTSTTADMGTSDTANA